MRTALASRFTTPVVFLAVVLLSLIGWQMWQTYRPIALPGTPASAEVIEERWGIRITHIAVLADGGLIDFRFQILDPEKAMPLFNLEDRPLLYVETTGQLVDSLYHPPHGHELVAGYTQYFLYNNHGGVIKPGTLVSVILGDLRLEHIVAQ